MSKTIEKLTDEEILSNFSNKKKSIRNEKDTAKKALFCRLVRATRKAGLDWWDIKDDGLANGAYCGRKNKNEKSPKAEKIALAYYASTGKVESVGAKPMPFGSAGIFNRNPLAEKIDAIETALTDGSLFKENPKLRPRPDAIVYWPQDLPPPKKNKTDQRSAPAAEAPKKSAAHQPKLADSTPRKGNWIYYGPPGTGKTFGLSQLFKRYTDEATASTAGERRKLIIEKEITQRTWWEAVVAALHDLEGHAKVPDLEKHRYIKAFAAAKGRTQNIKQTLWSSLQLHTVNTSTTVKMKARTEPPIFDKKADSTWSLLNGWEEFCPDLAELLLGSKDEKPSPNNRYAFVTFHQSYGYEEFVEGLRPVLGEAGAEGGEVQYEIRAGVFKVLCEKAREAQKEAKEKGKDIPRYAMVIDEINRGNISKIFGELITLIEDDKREGEKNAIAITLPYSGESFSVPANVDIIGTMNTADRSLALLDTALRRRFEFVPMLPDTRDEEGAPLHKLEVEGIDIRLMLETMNKRIEVLYDRDHCIGHAYFTKLKGEGMATLDELGKIFKNKIIPLLEEYFFEDWNKIRLVLGDKSKTDDAQFIHETKMSEKELTKVFGKDHGLESDNLAPRYEINPDAFENISAYTGIYASPKAHKSPASTEADAE